MDKEFSKNSLDPVFYVNDLDTLRVLTDPFRLQILGILSPEPQTINQVADKLGLSSSRLYYHFNLLEEHGLVKVVETRTVNNIIEKVFWISAEDIDIHKDLLSFSAESGQENIIRILQSSLDALREDFLRSLQVRKFHLAKGNESNPHEAVMFSIKKRLRYETYQEFLKRIKAVIDEFSNLKEETGKGQDINEFGFSCYIYPSYYYEQDNDTIQGSKDNEKTN